MKNRIMRIGLAIAALILALGMLFCILRPAYVKEAVQILLKNELIIEPEGSGDMSEDPVPEEESAEESSVGE